MKKNQHDYKENGISFSKASISVGDEITLSYKGILTQNSSQSIFVHFGYGESWEENELMPMNSEKGVYKAKLKIKHPGSLNFCFKDNEEVWDNNEHNNYSVSVEEKKAKAIKTSATGESKSKKECSKTDTTGCKTAVKKTTKAKA